MTPEIHKHYANLKAISEAIVPFIELWEIERKTFEEKARLYANGTLDAILPHFMSIQDMHTSQKHLTNAIKVSKLLGELRTLLVREEEKAI